MAKKKKQPETVVETPEVVVEETTQEETQPETVVVEEPTPEPVQETGSVAVLANAIRHNGKFYEKGRKLSKIEVNLIKKIGFKSYINQ